MTEYPVANYPINFRASPALIMENWEPGDGWKWEHELLAILVDRPEKLVALAISILQHGFREPLEDEEPVILGNDARVWSGHHRILAASLARDLVCAHEIEKGVDESPPTTTRDRTPPGR